VFKNKIKAISSIKDLPINLLAFNRPEYFERSLESIFNQSLKIDPSQVFIWIDGYKNSKDEFYSLKNNTSKVYDIALKYVEPKNIFLHKINLGIANNYHRSEIFSFNNLKVEAAFFTEEDLVLTHNYFEILLKILSKTQKISRISNISATGDTFWDKTLGENAYYTNGHAWGYILMRNHWQERLNFLEKYLDIVSIYPYFQKSKVEELILDLFLDQGIILAGLSQDAVKDGLRNYYGKVSITTGKIYATNIGILGENFSHETSSHNQQVNSENWNLDSDIGEERLDAIYRESITKTNKQFIQNILKPILAKIENLTVR
jgi:hypothetical protein